MQKGCPSAELRPSKISMAFVRNRCDEVGASRDSEREEGSLPEGTCWKLTGMQSVVCGFPTGHRKPLVAGEDERNYSIIRDF